jgi:hypothetical protein
MRRLQLWLCIRKVFPFARQTGFGEAMPLMGIFRNSVAFVPALIADCDGLPGLFGGIHRHVQIQLFGNIGGGAARARAPNAPPPGPVPAAGAPGVPPAAAAPRPVRVAVGFNINIRVLLQFLVLGLIVYQVQPVVLLR